ncbi:MAG: AAA family ATPase [Deltaproteobacteria bacterium]|nr:AAA family ATPase [Deltaproteobacteria bacterium]
MTIRVLEISRFRGIGNLLWRPAAGMNVIVGGGDVGKTTILDAIALLLSPSNSFTISESDFWMRDTSEEFSVSAVVSIPAESGISTQSSFAAGRWDGKDAIFPVLQVRRRRRLRAGLQNTGSERNV